MTRAAQLAVGSTARHALGSTARLAIVTAVWLFLVKYGGRLLFAVVPAGSLSGVSPVLVDLALQVSTTIAGVALGALLLSDLRRDLGLGSLSSTIAARVGLAVLAAPTVVIASTFVALKIAEPMLVREMAERGAGVSRQNAGAMAQQLLEAPAWVVLLWAVVFAALFEELLFRGALWSLIQRLVEPKARPHVAPVAVSRTSEEMPVTGPTTSDATSFEDELAAMKGPSVIERVRANGTIATVGSALLFSAMHLGVPGGVGVLRVVSTLLLGLACGLARQLTGTVLAAVAIHLVNNLTSVPVVRRALVSETFPVSEGIPTLLVVVALVGLAPLGALGVRKFVEHRREAV